MSIFQRLVRYDDPDSLVSKLRRARGATVRRLIEAVFAEKGECRILDIGGEVRYWQIFEDDYLRRHRVSITVLNLGDEGIGHQLATGLIRPCSNSC